MKVRGIVWMGVQTDRHNEMTGFLRRLFGAEEDITEPGFSLWALPDGSLVEVFAGGTKPPFEGAPVVGFRVDDLAEARRDLLAAGAEIVGGYGPNESGYASIHFRAPDGNIYEVVEDPDHETRGRGR